MYNRYAYRPHRHSPLLGFAFVFLMIMLFTKGFALLIPLLLIGLGFMMLKGRGMNWNSFCDGDMGTATWAKNSNTRTTRVNRSAIMLATMIPSRLSTYSRERFSLSAFQPIS
jgi:hypothetical protein